MFQKIKNFLKRILPPPVKAFNREVERILSAIRETQDKVRTLQKQHTDTQKALVDYQTRADQNFQTLTDAAVGGFAQTASLQSDIVARLGSMEQQNAEIAARLFASLEHMNSEFKALAEEHKTIRQIAETQSGELALLRQQAETQSGELALLRQQAETQSGELALLRQQVETQSSELVMLRQQVEMQNGELALLRQQAETQSKELTQKVGQEHTKLLNGQKGVVSNIRQLMLTQYCRTTEQPRLPYFVLNILDHCNLRCKGCDHFAAIAEERFVALDDICRDLKQMAKLTQGNVTRIGVMGGEPLLHPQLKEILIETRRWFPATLVQLVSNGILLLQQDDEFWEICRDQGITIVVTRYPLKLDYERMEQTATHRNVNFEFYGNTREAAKVSGKRPLDIEGKQNPIRSFGSCFHANALPLLMEGKFYPCTVAPNIRHFNKKFGTNMSLEEGDWLDIYKAKDAAELYQFLCTPKPFCRYCKTPERSRGLVWERSKQLMEEWT